MKILMTALIVFGLLVTVILYACLVVGARADRQMEAMLEAEEAKRQNKELTTENC